jgi:hypothetical protein
MFIKGFFFAVLIWAVSGIALLLWGDRVLMLIKSQTPLLSAGLVALALLVGSHEIFINIVSYIPLSKNEVPFFKISLVIGIVTLVLLFVFFKYAHIIGVLGMIIAPGIAEFIHWMWMWGAVKELKITRCDISHSLYDMMKIVNIKYIKYLCSKN